MSEWRSRTDNAGETFIAGYGLAMVALAPLELLREIHGGLLGFPLQV